MLTDSFVVAWNQMKRSENASKNKREIPAGIASYSSVHHTGLSCFLSPTNLLVKSSLGSERRRKEILPILTSVNLTGDLDFAGAGSG
jgi:hypothetical protein